MRMEPDPSLEQEQTGVNRWRYHFVYRGRHYTLFKVKDSKDANYYIHVQRLKQRYKHSLETNARTVAIDRSKVFIDAVIGEKWEVVEKLKTRRSIPSLKQVIDVYYQISGLPYRTTHNNVLSMLKILERVDGVRPDPATVPLTRIDRILAHKYQDIVLRDYVSKALAEGGLEREARERAFRSSGSVIKQARSLFTRKGSQDVVMRYEEHNIYVPETVSSFMTTKLRGKSVKEEYLAPPESVIQQAFNEIEKARENDANVYLAFWCAVGGGLRRSEIQRLEWSHFIERKLSANDPPMVWISGGIGKDGQRIEVPVQSKAWERLQPFRKTTGYVLSERGVEWAKRLNFWMKIQGWKTEKKLHELRAYVGSLIYQRSPMAAMKFMRHKSISITERFYCRYGPTTKPVDVL